MRHKDIQDFLIRAYRQDLPLTGDVSLSYVIDTLVNRSMHRQAAQLLLGILDEQMQQRASKQLATLFRVFAQGEHPDWTKEAGRCAEWSDVERPSAPISERIYKEEYFNVPGELGAKIRRVCPHISR